MTRRATGETLLHVRDLLDVGAMGGWTDGQLLDRFRSAPSSLSGLAFGVLVRRHGPAVLNVCRRVLGDRHEAEDAFQATFLVLAHRAGSIRRPEALGAWLRGVARRVSVRADARSSRRRKTLRNYAAEAAAPSAGAFPPEAAALVREEVGRLPESLRAAVVLCYLEGRTYEEAARLLRISGGAVRGRLARAREALRPRLERRGVTASAALSVGAMADVPRALEARTALAAARIAGGSAPPATISISVTNLVEGALATMRFGSWKAAVSAALGLGFLGAGVGVVAARSDPPSAAASAAVARIDPPQDAPKARSGSAPGPKVEEALAALAGGRVVRAAEVSKDAMILAYLPVWDHGEVDNLGVANNDGGVRTLLAWDDPPSGEVEPPGRRFLLALYARQTDARGPGGPILAFDLEGDWAERTSWKSRPEAAPEPFASYPFAPGEGWKVFDVTPIVRERAKADRKGRGVMLRFLSEDRAAPKFSGYQFVSREGHGEWKTRRPLLLVVDPPKG